MERASEMQQCSPYHLYLMSLSCRQREPVVGIQKLSSLDPEQRHKRECTSAPPERKSQNHKKLMPAIMQSQFAIESNEAGSRTVRVPSASHAGFDQWSASQQGSDVAIVMRIAACAEL
jgi:hypothetical protein